MVLRGAVRDRCSYDSLVAVRVVVSPVSVTFATVELPFVSRPRRVVIRALSVRLPIAPLPHVAVV